MKATPKEKKAILNGLIELLSQNRRWLLFVGTGASCELDRRLGMPELAAHLRSKIPHDALGWPDIRSRLDSGQSLEMALTGVALPPKTKSLIQQETGAYVAGIDRELRDDVLTGCKRWVGEELVNALGQRLPPYNPRLTIVTPNYDMLIEYSCAKNTMRYTSGHVGEIIRTWNWQQAQGNLTRASHVVQSSKKVGTREPLPRIELHKVHGSINLIRDPKSGRQWECDIWAEKVPDGFERVVAVPGEQKFESYASNVPVANCALEAEAKAAAFLVIGYGFNDAHLHQGIYDRVRRNDGPLLILTLELTDNRITELRTLGKRVWILTASRDASGNLDMDHTVIHCPLSDSPLVIEDEKLWSCDSFAKQILGD